VKQNCDADPENFKQKFPFGSLVLGGLVVEIRRNGSTRAALLSRRTLPETSHNSCAVADRLVFLFGALDKSPKTMLRAGPVGGVIPF
jgi:hypothetical protein